MVCSRRSSSTVHLSPLICSGGPGEAPVSWDHSATGITRVPGPCGVRGAELAVCGGQSSPCVGDRARRVWGTELAVCGGQSSQTAQVTEATG
uniref:Uncharacterized protein n=1 Tax=Knipowitschia caucasica TaxID=637954 RepID=A0AAV2L6T0_KNICA